MAPASNTDITVSPRRTSEPRGSASGGERLPLDVFPAPACILNEDAIILEINVAARTLLWVRAFGVERLLATPSLARSTRVRAAGPDTN